MLPKTIQIFKLGVKFFFFHWCILLFVLTRFVFFFFRSLRWSILFHGNLFDPSFEKKKNSLNTMSWIISALFMIWVGWKSWTSAHHQMYKVISRLFWWSHINFFLKKSLIDCFDDPCLICIFKKKSLWYH